MAGNQLNFGDTGFEGQIAPSTPILQPVTEDAMFSREAGALAQNVFNTVSKGFNEVGAGMINSAPFFSDVFNNQTDDKKYGVLEDFQQKMGLIADAVDQGRISVPEARSRMRVLNSQYVADNPTLIKDINDLQAQYTKTAGLGDIITSGNEDYQRSQKLIDTAVAAGWKAPGMSDEEAVNNYIKAQQDGFQLTAFKNDIDRKHAMRQEITEADKFKATNILHNFVADAFPWMVSQVENGRTMIEQGADPATVLQQVKDNIAQEEAKVGSLRAAAGDTDTSYMTDGIDKLVQNLDDWANKKTSTEVYKGKIDNIKAQQELALRSDPEVGPTIMASNLLPSSDPSIIMKVSQAASRLFGQNAQDTSDPNGPVGAKPADVIGQDKNIDSYLTVLKSGIDNSIANPTPEAQKEVSTHITNLLRGISAYGNNATNAKDFRSIIEFFASPNVGKYAEMNKGIIPDAVKTQALSVIQAQYEKVLLPLIKEKWDQGRAVIADANGFMDQKGVNTSDVIEPYWNGSGVGFKAKPGYENMPEVQTWIKELTSSPGNIVGPLNTLIRAEAHMSGTTDYKSVYENTLQARLWGSDAATTDTKQIQDLAGGSNKPDNGGEFSDVVDKIAKIESNNNPNADNPNSSALGTHQITDGTWKLLMKTHPELGLTPDGRTDPEQSNKAANALTADNATFLSAHGVDTTPGNLYLAHFLGSQGAVNVLGYSDGSDIRGILSPNAISANSKLKFEGKLFADWTVGDLKAWANGLMT